MSHSSPHRTADDLPVTTDSRAVLDGYVSIVVSDDDSPDECTIFPLDASEVELVTTWVSAAEGSFVSIASMC